MKRIKLYGYFAGNLGDDLMVDILLKRYPQYEFFCDTWQSASNRFLRWPNFRNREGLLEKYGRVNHLCNILTLYRKKDAYLMGALRRYEESCSCSVYIGGSLFMQEPGERPEVRMEREAWKLKNGPLFIIGANFGPYREEAFLRAFGDFFSRCGGVTFRDKASFDLFFQEGGNIGYGPDVVLNLDAQEEKKNAGTVLISVINLENRKTLRPFQQSYESWMASLCNACIRRGKQPVLMSFCAAEGDEDAVRGILEKMEPQARKRTGKLCYRGDPAPFFDAYRRADRVIATRFHAMILAMCFRKPFFSIAYDQKVKHVLEDLAFDRWCPISGLEAISPGEALDRCALPENLEAYRQAAAKQFSQLDAFLEGAKACRR